MSTSVLIKDGDLVLDASGRPVVIDGSTKRDQDIANVLLTPLDLTRLTGAFGNEFLIRLDGQDSPALPNERLIGTSVTEAIERLQELQRQNAELTDDEEIVSIEELIVKPLKGDQTSYVFLLRLRSRSGNEATLARKLTFGHHNVPERLTNSPR